MTELKAKDFRGIKVLGDGLRIKRKLWHAPAFYGSCFCLQKKGFMGFWFTKAWIYVDIIKNKDQSYIEHFLRWDMKELGK